jgi:hypothetical protein
MGERKRLVGSGRRMLEAHGVMARNAEANVHDRTLHGKLEGRLAVDVWAKVSLLSVHAPRRDSEGKGNQ